MSIEPGKRIAIVTGAGRLRGIGAAICRALAADGADIFFTTFGSYDRAMPWGADADEPEQLQAEIAALGVRCDRLEVDLAHPDAAAELFDAVEARLGSASILVNNAAYSTQSNFRSLDAQTLDAHYAVNLRATALLSVEFARRSADSGSGRIVNLTSGQSKGAMPGEIAYAATKGAIDALTVTLADELAEFGITVNAVNPGPTDTGWITDELRRSLLPQFPMGRIGQPEDVARLVAFLASDRAQWITGQIIHSEGGFRRASP